MSSVTNASANNLTLMKSVLKSELKKLFSDRDNIVKSNNAKFTKLKEFDNSIYNTLLKSRNGLLDLTKDHHQYQDSNNILNSMQNDLNKQMNTRNLIIRDIQTEINYLNNIVKSIQEFKKTFVQEILILMKAQYNDNSITNTQLDKMANNVFEDTFQSIFRKKKTDEDLNFINTSFKKRYRRSPSKSPTQSPTKVSRTYSKTKKRVKIDESKNKQFTIPKKSPSP